jgi:hypothetical protein
MSTHQLGLRVMFDELQVSCFSLTCGSMVFIFDVLGSAQSVFLLMVENDHSFMIFATV